MIENCEKSESIKKVEAFSVSNYSYLNEFIDPLSINARYFWFEGCRTSAESLLAFIKSS